MKTKDLTPLTEVYLYQRGQYGNESKVVVLDAALWTRQTYHSSRSITRAVEGARAEESVFNRSTGVLVLYAHRETSDAKLRALAGRLTLDEIAESIDQVEAKFQADLEAADARIGVALPTRIKSTWAEHVEGEKAAKAYRQEQTRVEQEQEAERYRQRRSINELAAKVGAPVKVENWQRKAEVSFTDMVELLERLGRAEGSL